MILDFEIDNCFLENSLTEFANTIRTLLFEEDESIFELIDIGNDKIFLEPSLFSYFSNKNMGRNTPPLLQLLWGYIDVDRKPERIDVSADSSGIIALPNYGCLLCQPYKRYQISFEKDQGEPRLIDQNGVVDAKIFAPVFLEGSTIQLAINQPEFLFQNKGADVLEPVLDTTKRYEMMVNDTWRKMENMAKDFTILLERTNREIMLFNSLTQYSKASYSYYGTAFINVADKTPTEVFFS